MLLNALILGLVSVGGFCATDVGITGNKETMVLISSSVDSQEIKLSDNAYKGMQAIGLIAPEIGSRGKVVATSGYQFLNVAIRHTEYGSRYGTYSWNSYRSFSLRNNKPLKNLLAMRNDISHFSKIYYSTQWYLYSKRTGNRFPIVTKVVFHTKERQVLDPSKDQIVTVPSKKVVIVLE